jgi:peptidoglycan biosynthesis protein MviN/MurJ (putative lipid II flippase)
MDRTLPPLVVNAGVLVVNYVLSRILSPTLGGAGLALATAISITLGGAALTLALLGRSAERLRQLGKLLVSALVMALPLYWATGLVVTGGEGKLLLVVKCGALGVLGAALYLLLLLVLRQEDLLELLPRRKKS